MRARRIAMVVMAVAASVSGQELKDLRPLPRTWAWCEQDNRIYERADLEVVRQVARICGTVAVRIDGDRLRAEHVRTAAKLAGELRVPLVGVWSPWGFGQLTLAAPDPADVLESVVDVKSYGVRPDGFTAKLQFPSEDTEVDDLVEFRFEKGYIELERVGDCEKRKGKDAGDGSDADQGEFEGGE